MSFFDELKASLEEAVEIKNGIRAPASIQQYGIEKQFYAHVLHTSVLGMPIIYVVITNDFELEPYKNYTAVMVADETEAQALALKHNAIIVTSYKANQ